MVGISQMGKFGSVPRWGMANPGTPPDLVFRRLEINPKFFA
jgi:hypothetical protein